METRENVVCAIAGVDQVVYVFLQLGTGSWVNYRYRVFTFPFNERLPSVSENALT